MAELSSGVEISVLRIMLVTIHRRFMRDIFPKIKMVKVKINFTVYEFEVTERG
jgi:hypothetical protein